MSSYLRLIAGSALALAVASPACSRQRGTSDPGPIRTTTVTIDECVESGFNDDRAYCYKAGSDGQLHVALPFGLIFQLEDNLRLCRPVFEQQLFFDSLMRVGAWGTTLSADDIREGYSVPQPPQYREQANITWREFLWEGTTRGILWKVYSGVRSWTHLNIDVGDAVTVVHAEIKPLGDPNGQYAEVIMYGTSCAPKKLYGVDIAEFDRMSRYLFIAAHELGHLMDYYAGGTTTLGSTSPDIERRATLYGSYLMECWLTILARDFGGRPGVFGVLGSRLPQDMRPLQADGVFKSEKDRRCAVRKWRALAAQMEALRRRVDSADFATSLSGAAQCRGPRETQ